MGSLGYHGFKIDLIGDCLNPCAHSSLVPFSGEPAPIWLDKSSLYVEYGVLNL